VMAAASSIFRPNSGRSRYLRKPRCSSSPGKESESAALLAARSGACQCRSRKPAKSIPRWNQVCRDIPLKIAGFAKVVSINPDIAPGSGRLGAGSRGSRKRLIESRSSPWA
jgi:hypothetical protein